MDYRIGRIRTLMVVIILVPAALGGERDPACAALARRVNGHYVSLGANGRLEPLTALGDKCIPERARVDAILDPVNGEVIRGLRDMQTPHLLLYAHGGLVPENAAMAQVADLEAAMARVCDHGRQRVYVLAFVWHTGIAESYRGVNTSLTSVASLLQGGASSGQELEDRAPRSPSRDRLVEAEARKLTAGLVLWDAMKQNASDAIHYDRVDGPSHEVGGAYYVLTKLRAISDALSQGGASGSLGRLQVHLAGHSAGAIFMGHVAATYAGPPSNRYMARRPDAALGYGSGSGAFVHAPRVDRCGMGQAIASVTLWAPACTIDFYTRYYQPLLRDDCKDRPPSIQRMLVFTLSDSVDSTIGYHFKGTWLYGKTLLYIVSQIAELPYYHGRAVDGAARAPGGRRLFGYAVAPPDHVRVLGLERDLLAASHDGTINWQQNGMVGNVGWVVADGGTDPGQREGLQTVYPCDSSRHGGFAQSDMTLTSTRCWITACSAAKPPSTEPAPP